MRAGLSHQDHARKPEKAASGRLFTIQRLPFQGDTARFSCVVSKKVARTAVDRNRVRRRVRAAFRPLVVTGLFVIHIKKPALAAPFTEIARELAELSKKVTQ